MTDVTHVAGESALVAEVSESNILAVTAESAVADFSVSELAVEVTAQSTTSDIVTG